MESQSESTQTVSAQKLLVLKTGINGDSVSPVASASTCAEGPIPPKTVEQKLARKNELKAKSTLMLAIPDEHLLKFQPVRMQSPYRKLSRIGLDKTYDRFQKLISQLEIHGEVISQEDANLKLLRSLPSAWNTHTLIIQNKSDLDTLSMDDLYNNLKVYEAEIKGQSSSSSNSQNVAFVSLDNTSSTNEAVNTAHDVSAASSHGQASSSTYVDDVISQMAGGHAYHEGEEIHKEDMKKSEFEWKRNYWVVPVETPANALVVTDEMGYDWSYQAEEGPTNFALMAYTYQGSSSSSSSDFECEALNKSNLEIIRYQMGLESLEARIVFHEKNAAVYEDDIAFLKYDVQVKDISIKDLKNQLEEALKEKDDLKLKLENFEESSKNLTKLINSQISAKNNTGLGYDSQMNESEVVYSVFNIRESNVDDSPVNDRFKTENSVYKIKVSETENSISRTSKDIVEKPKTIWPSAPIIEEWDTDSDNDSVFRPKSDQTKPKLTKINFVKSGENVKTVNKENTHKQVENPRKS
ncbi:hypothetical protein Tco_1431890 [Tanacetum coccineum]